MIVGLALMLWRFEFAEESRSLRERFPEQRRKRWDKMTIEQLSSRAAAYLRKLCVEIPTRQVGSQGNHEATTFFDAQMKASGFQTETDVFDCMDWREYGVQLSTVDTSFAASASPYSLGCDVHTLLRVVTTVGELEAAELAGSVVLLRGEIASQQLMPRNFPFYNPEEHQHILRLLDTQSPLAIVAATGRDPQMAGSVYPFPLIEDGDFHIPSVFMTDEEGLRLAQYAGQKVHLESRAERIPSTGCNVVARKGGQSDRKVVCFAHIDAKRGTPGAIDNASGIIVLLLLAELLADYRGRLGVEMVALNGEDYYSSPGEQQYLARNAGTFDQIMLGINIDGVGYHRGRIAYSLYGSPQDIAQLVAALFSDQQIFSAGDPWYQGDHMLFIMNQRPALALTSEQATELLTEVIHTAADHPGIIDTHKLAAASLVLRDLLLRLNSGMTQ
ncbi:MAG TPA: M28 family peptidase [Spirillospora sp.]|nr:M28 family peptidase [Spirillospora sp.]